VLGDVENSGVKQQERGMSLGWWWAVTVKTVCAGIFDAGEGRQTLLAGKKHDDQRIGTKEAENICRSADLESDRLKLTYQDGMCQGCRLILAAKKKKTSTAVACSPRKENREELENHDKLLQRYEET
jgi:hypothetical protein